MNNMTSRERMLAAINRLPVDHLPFWPKIDCEYIDYQKDSSFAGWTVNDYHSFIGSDLHEFVPPHVLLDDTCGSSIKERKSGNETVIVYSSAAGECIGSEKFGHPSMYPIRNREDLLRMTAWFEGTDYVIDSSVVEMQNEMRKRLSDRGILALVLGNSPFMRTVQLLAGVEQTQYLLYDYPDEFEALMDAMHKDLLRKITLMVQYAPIDLFYMMENTSTTLLSPRQFKKYCKPYLYAYNQICREAGKKMALHMCGLLYDLLEDLGDLHIPVFEAFTSPTVGNTHLADGRKHCPDTCLIGGTNATQWLMSEDYICQEIDKELKSLDHHRGIIITSAGVMPPACPPEVIRQVCRYVKAYPHNTI